MSRRPQPWAGTLRRIAREVAKARSPGTRDERLRLCLLAGEIEGLIDHLRRQRDAIEYQSATARLHSHAATAYATVHAASRKGHQK